MDSFGGDRADPLGRNVERLAAEEAGIDGQAHDLPVLVEVDMLDLAQARAVASDDGCPAVDAHGVRGKVRRDLDRGWDRGCGAGERASTRIVGGDTGFRDDRLAGWCAPEEWNWAEPTATGPDVRQRGCFLVRQTDELFLDEEREFVCLLGIEREPDGPVGGDRVDQGAVDEAVFGEEQATVDDDGADLPGVRVEDQLVDRSDALPVAAHDWTTEFDMHRCLLGAIGHFRLVSIASAASAGKGVVTKMEHAGSR